ncbi:MAG: molybdopterin oxidoreductase family protein [Myxococcales bacterium]|nr:molybdopterin oxidoreductase family protein [Myxococcales bacterium]
MSPTLFREVRTHCPYCALQCGLTARGSSDNLQVAPDEAFPVNRGQMCIKGFSSPELLRREDRLLHPLRRTKAGFSRVTWTEALDAIASELEALRAAYGPAANAVYGSGALSNEKAYLLGKFARVALKTPNIDYNGRLCMASAAAAQRIAFGVDRGLPFPLADIAETKLLVLWGTNAADTLPPIAQWLNAQQSTGGERVVVDPRATATSRAANLHVQPVPGSDLALANGLMHILIDEGLVDETYVAARTRGFDEVRRVALVYDLVRVERLTGVPERTMRQLARMLAQAPSAMLLSGRGPEQQSKGTDTTLALVNLMLALGRVGRPYSGYGTLTGQGNGQGGREHGQKSDQLPGYRSIENAEDRRAVAAVWNVAPEDIPGKGPGTGPMLAAMGQPGGARSLLVFGSNLSVAMADAAATRARLASLDLLVVADAFMNDTSALAHFVLPVAQWIEEEGTVTNLEGRVIRRRKLFDPPATVLTDLQIIAGLAARLGQGARFGTDDPETIFEELRQATAGAVADYSGISYAGIDAHEGMFWPCPAAQGGTGQSRLFAEHFFHPDGRARFVAVEHRDAGEEPDSEYPVYLTTGRYKEHYNSGAQTRGVKRLQRLSPEARLEVHPRLAARVGLRDEGWALVESRRGRCVFRVALSPDIRDDTVFLPFHFGDDQSANLLTHATTDPTSGMPEFKLCAVRLLPATEGRKTLA